MRASPPETGRVPAAQPVAGRWRTRAERAGDRYQRQAERSPLLRLPLVFAARYAGRQGGLLASALAFRLFLWLLPLALVLSGSLALVSEDRAHALQRSLDAAGVAGTTGRSIVTALHDGHRSWWVAVVVGAGLLVWATRALTRTLIAATAQLWDVPPVRRSQRSLIATSLLLDGVLFSITAISAPLVHVRTVGPVGVVVALLLRIVLVTGLWVVVVRRLLPRTMPLRAVVPGGLVFGVGLVVLNSVGQAYLPSRFERASELYGSLGVAATVVAWLLVVGHLIVSAVLVTAVWAAHQEAEPGKANG